MDKRNTKDHQRITVRLAAFAIVVVLSLIATGALAGVLLQDVNPNTSTVAQNRNATSGGRVNGLAMAPNNNQVVYAASEWGGLYRTTDGGANWVHLDNHQPQAAWDVLVDPTNASRVFATSFFDGKVNSLAGINISTDGGNTWTHPVLPDTSPGCPTTRLNEPSAWGIAIRPDAANNVFIGTNCGLAISTDSGATWTQINPNPAQSGREVYDVVAQAGGVIDICGVDGHYRSTDNGTNWTAVNPSSPTGFCSLAASPLEPNVLFMTAGGGLWESANSGATWTQLDDNIGGRIPFVVTNQRSATNFDLYLGMGRGFFRQINCDNDGTSPPRCQQGNTTDGTVNVGTDITGNAHDDGGDLEFDLTQAVPRCPLYYSSDGGIYSNTNTADPGCQTPSWQRAMNGLHATWLFDLDGASLAGPNTGLYFGLQDDGFWGSADAAANWANPECCDVFDVAADAAQVVYSVCCFNTQPSTRMYRRPANNPGGARTNIFVNGSNPPSGWLFEFNQEDSIDQFGAGNYVLVTSTTNRIDTAGGANGNGGVWITQDNFGTFTQLGAASTPAGACGVHAAVTGGTPTFYVLTGGCNGFGGTLWRYTGTAPGGTWTRADTGLTSVAVYAVDPNNPNNLYAADLAAAGPRMVLSNDGGATWNPDTELDALMTGNGSFLYQTNSGPTDFRTFGFFGYPQPSLLAYNPGNGSHIVAGGRDSGVFFSSDGGQNWGLLTDPFNPGASGLAHLPRPFHAYFDNTTPNETNLYIGTEGRGVWRFVIHLPTANAGGPYTTDEGTDVILNGSGTDPDGGTIEYAWDLDNDGDFDDAFVANPIFDRVGQDDVYPIALKVSSNGVFDIDETTVTVNNVEPTVVLNSNDPVDEGDPLTVAGVISDPGWLDVLTATIDWGDGITPVTPIMGVLENNRPDATFTFSVAHVYGDNGTFSVTICGSDDDSTVCESADVEVKNVDPTAEIDEGSATLVNGIPTFLAHAGEPIQFSGRSTDPGSDDLYLGWDWDDGSPSPDVTTVYLVNPPNPDPPNSPSIQPRDVTDVQEHIFGEACLYQISFLALDDDGGAGSDQAYVIITGNADKTQHEGYWQHQYSRNGNTDFDDSTLECYLSIVDFVSDVFDEARNASSIPAAFDVLFLKQNGGSEIEQLDRELLTVWLNFANGALEYDQLVDTDKDKVPDTPLFAVVDAAESVRLDPNATPAQLREQTQILHQLNNLK